jgi:alpha-glucosidase
MYGAAILLSATNLCMQIFLRPSARPNRYINISVAVRTLATVLLLSALSSAQTLARPGWVGSGLTSQAWWQSSVIYRVDPQSFQDSDGDGVGDLRGLADRLDYLQSIGVDAALIQSRTDEPATQLANDVGFDDLISDASRHHIRILVTLGPESPDQNAHPLSSEQVMNEARTWLRRGVAGVYIPSSVLSTIAAHATFHDAVSLLQQLRSLADSFPGERIVIAGDSPAVSAATENSQRSGPEIVDGSVDPTPFDAATLRTRLALADSPSAGEPLLGIAPHADPQPGRDRILAALFLSSRGAVAIDYGQEIGLPNAGTTAVMRWTPSNVTHPQAANATKPKQEVYGTYHPYVRAAPIVRPRLPSVTLNTESAPPPVDPNTLPGFSSRALPGASSWDKTINVAVEDDDPDSLLNFYRRVLELHSSNATFRTGSVSFLNHDSEGALVWLRRAPAGARTVASVIVACNLTDHPIQLSLNSDLAHVHIAGGTLRPLLTSLHVDHVSQSTGYLRLSPHSVYVGELYGRR